MPKRISIVDMDIWTTLREREKRQDDKKNHKYAWAEGAYRGK